MSLSQCKLLPTAQQGDDQTYRFARAEVAGKEERLKLLTSQIVPANVVDDVDDLASLVHVHEAAVLASICARSARGMHFTWAGDRVLLITRPPESHHNASRPMDWRPLMPSAIAPYAVASNSRSPHIHSLAESLYRRAVLTRQVQSMLLLGERGAGKTHQLQQAVRYMCCRAVAPFGQASGNSTAAARIAEVVLGSCALLSPLTEGIPPSGAYSSQCSRVVQARSSHSHSHTPHTHAIELHSCARQQP